MKRKIIIFSLISLLIGLLSGIVIGNYHKNTENQKIVCTVTEYGTYINYTIWVDPDYNQFPEYYAAERFFELYGIYPQKHRISCNDFEK